jgi:TolB-like protein
VKCVLQNVTSFVQNIDAMSQRFWKKLIARLPLTNSFFPFILSSVFTKKGTGVPMKRKYLFALFSFALLFSMLCTLSWAGQVITNDDRMWAQDALKKENALQTVKAKNTIAVLNFQNKTNQPDLDPLQKGLALMLITDLSKVPSLQVIERVRIQALVEEMGLGVSGLVEQGTAPRAGKLLGAKWLVGGNFSEGQQTQLDVNSNILDVPVQKILAQSLAKGPLSELFRIEKDILFDIIKQTKIQVTPQKEKELKKPCSTNSKALIVLFKGIDESDKQNYENAASYFEQSLKEDPSICIAHDAISELKSLGLLKIKKRTKQTLRSLREQTSTNDELTSKDAVRREPTPKSIPNPVDVIINIKEK